jgi:hypothetical protein
MVENVMTDRKEMLPPKQRRKLNLIFAILDLLVMLYRIFR